MPDHTRQGRPIGRVKGVAPVPTGQDDLFARRPDARPVAPARDEVTRSIIDGLDDASGSRAPVPESAPSMFRPAVAPSPARPAVAPAPDAPTVQSRPGRVRLGGATTRPAPPAPAAASSPPPADPAPPATQPRAAPPRKGLGGLGGLARSTVADEDPGDGGAGPAPDDSALHLEEAPAPRQGGGLANLSRGTGADEDDPRQSRPGYVRPTGDLMDAPREEGLLELKGRIKRQIYKSDQPGSDFRILLLATEGGKEVTVTTESPTVIAVNEKVVVRGTWSEYKGRTRFKATYMVPEIPKDARGIVTWLKSGAVSGIGGRTADRLAKHFGEELQAALGDPARLVTGGIDRRRAEMISKTYLENVVQTELVLFLGSLGLGESMITRIIKRYGMASRRVIEDNPWILADTIDGVGFATADDIGLRHGHPRDSADRIKAAIRHELRAAVRTEGHCGLPLPEMMMRTVKLTSLPARVIQPHVDAALDGEGAVYDPETGLAAPVPIKECEDGIAAHLVDLMDGRGLSSADAATAIREAEGSLGVRLDPSQVDAALLALTMGVCIITGGPGTGKTTTMRVIVHAMKASGRRPVLAAPTGRAAKRLAEVSGEDASTCHRLLQFQASIGGFAFNAEEPFPEDAFILDEFSMMDVRLTHSFVQAVRKGSWLVCVGDVDQLPSVGPGQVLRDLIESGVIPTARLSTVHRQGKDSGIVAAAHNINSGHHPVPESESFDDFRVESYEDTRALAQRIVTLMRDELPRLGYDAIQDVQVLAPTRKKELGVDSLNVAIKEALNPVLDDGRSVTIGGRSFTVGDRVMHTRNDYAKGVFNGEVGTVHAPKYGQDKNGSRTDAGFVVDYSGDLVEYVAKDVSDVEQAWATTVHKSQGCEFPVVIFACHAVHTYMLNRNLAYTAVTRAKRLCIVVGDEGVLAGAAHAGEGRRRFTGLRKLLVAEKERRLVPEDEPRPFLELDLDLFPVP